MSNIENWHRRHALALASQLPDNANDALLVIEATREIVERFLMPKEVERPLINRPANVVSLSREG